MSNNHAKALSPINKQHKRWRSKIALSNQQKEQELKKHPLLYSVNFLVKEVLSGN